MKHQNKINIKLPKVDWLKLLKSTGITLSLAFMTAFLISAVAISIPGLENYIPQQVYNLTIRNDYYTKEFVVETSEIDPDALANVKEILVQRLQKYGVNNIVSSEFYTQVDNTSTTITIGTSTESVVEETIGTSTISFIINYSGSQEDIEALLTKSNSVKILTRKSDVNFDESEYSFASYLPENYNQTEFNQDTFRNFEVKKLKNINKEFSYYAIFKVKAEFSDEFSKFLRENSGQIIGIEFDGYVKSYQIPNYNQSSGIQDIVLYVGETESDGRVYSSVLNSDLVTSTLSVKEVKDGTPINLDFDVYKLMFIWISVILLSSAFLYYKTKSIESVIKFTLSITFVLSGWIAYYKVSLFPMSILPFIFASIIVLFLAFISYFKQTIFKPSSLLISTITLLFYLLSSGLLKEISYSIIVATLFYIISTILTEFYYINMKKYVIKW